MIILLGEFAEKLIEHLVPAFLLRNFHEFYHPKKTAEKSCLMMEMIIKIVFRNPFLVDSSIPEIKDVNSCNQNDVKQY